MACQKAHAHVEHFNVTAICRSSIFQGRRLAAYCEKEATRKLAIDSFFILTVRQCGYIEEHADIKIYDFSHS